MEKLKNCLRYVIIWCIVVWGLGCSLRTTMAMAWRLWMLVARQAAGTQKDPRKRSMAAWKPEGPLMGSNGGWQVCKHDPMKRIMAARKPEELLVDSNGGWQVCKHDPMKRIMAARKPEKLLMDSNSRWQVCKHVPEAISKDFMERPMAARKPAKLLGNSSSERQVCKHVPETIGTDEISLLTRREKLNSQRWKYVMTSRLIVMLGIGWPEEDYVRLSKSASREEVGLAANGSKKRESQMLETRCKIVTFVGDAFQGSGNEALCIHVCTKTKASSRATSRPSYFGKQVVFVSCLIACIEVAVYACGISVHSNILKSGYEAKKVDGNSLMEIHSQRGSMGDAYQVFNQSARDAVFWNMMLAGDVVFWNMMLARTTQREARDVLVIFQVQLQSCTQSENDIGGLCICWQMQQTGEKLNQGTFIMVLGVCSTIATFNRGKWIHAKMPMESCKNGSTQLMQNCLSQQQHVEALAAYLNVAPKLRNDAPIGFPGTHDLGGSALYIFCVFNDDATHAGCSNAVEKQQREHVNLEAFLMEGLQFAAYEYEPNLLEFNLEFFELGKDEIQHLLLGHDCTTDASNTCTKHAQGQKKASLILGEYARKLPGDPQENRFDRENFDVNTSRCQGFLEGASLHKIRLAPDTDHGRAQQTNLEYLLLLDVDSLVWSFRKNAGLSTPGSSYGGWEAPSSELRGHFVGHYLSATAMMWASTHNDSILTKATNVVTALAKCQRQLGTGYLSAFPTELFDRSESLQPVGAPSYTIHKIMAGLLDQYVFAGNSQALYMVKLMADYFLARVENVIRNYTIERHWLSLNEETGGMNDILYRLYAITGNAGHLELAHLFDKPCFLGPLAVQADSLSGFHTNTHIPIIIGAQMRYEVVKDDIYKDIAITFMDIVNSSHRYATGGTSVGEFWSDPNRLGSTLGTENEESCTTYNMLKVARNLFRWTKGMMYADYYEHALLNGVLSIQNVEEPGVMLYMLPLAPGGSKGRSYHGWGTKYNSFWCCYGTGIESFSKLGDSIYFQTKGGTPEVYIIQFVSSTFTWDDANLLITQTVSSWSSYYPLLNVTVSFKTAQENGVYNTTNSNIYIRIPNWTCSTGGQALVAGTKIELPDPGFYLNIFREWKSGDNINISLQVRLRIEKIQDDRPEYSSLYAIFFGPYLLVGMSDGNFSLGTVNMASLADWIVPVHPSAGQHLYTFGQRRKVGTVILRDVDGTVMMTPWQYSNKTNWAHHATFKMTTPVRHCMPRVAKDKTLFDEETFNYLRRRTLAEELMYRVISLESSHQPGKYIAHNGLNRKVTLFDQPRSCSYPIAKEEDLNAVFQVLPPLSHEENHVSFEAAGLPGCFLYAEPWKLEAAVELRCVEEEDEHFKFGSSFYVQEGLVGYHPMSFVAHGSIHTFLLVPFYAVRDENYTVYFQMN